MREKVNINQINHNEVGSNRSSDTNENVKRSNKRPAKPTAREVTSAEAKRRIDAALGLLKLKGFKKS